MVSPRSSRTSWAPSELSVQSYSRDAGASHQRRPTRSASLHSIATSAHGQGADDVGLWGHLELLASRSASTLPPHAQEHRVPLTRAEYTIGRAELGERVKGVPYSETKLVSTRHFTVAHREGAVAVVDWSSNGTFLNGERLHRGMAAPIAHGDVLTLVKPSEAKAEFSFRLHVAGAPPVATVLRRTPTSSPDLLYRHSVLSELRASPPESLADSTYSTQRTARSSAPRAAPPPRAADAPGVAHLSVGVGLGSASMFNAEVQGSVRGSVAQGGALAGALGARRGTASPEMGAAAAAAETADTDASTAGRVQMILTRRRLLRQMEAGTGKPAGVPPVPPPPPPAGADGVAGVLAAPLAEWLARHGLAELEAPLRAGGVARLAELCELENDDLAALGLGTVHVTLLAPALAALPHPAAPPPMNSAVTVGEALGEASVTGSEVRSGGRGAGPARARAGWGEAASPLLRWCNGDGPPPLALLYSDGNGVGEGFAWWRGAKPGEPPPLLPRATHLVALTSPSWPHDAEFDAALDAADAPCAYTQYVTLFLATYKPYLTKAQLFAHLHGLIAAASHASRPAGVDRTTWQTKRLPTDDAASRIARRAWYVIRVWLATHPDDIGRAGRIALEAMLRAAENMHGGRAGGGAGMAADVAARRRFREVRDALSAANRLPPLAPPKPPPLPPLPRAASPMTAAVTAAKPEVKHDPWAELMAARRGGGRYNPSADRRGLPVARGGGGDLDTDLDDGDDLPSMSPGANSAGLREARELRSKGRRLETCKAGDDTDRAQGGGADAYAAGGDGNAQRRWQRAMRFALQPGMPPPPRPSKPLSPSRTSPPPSPAEQGRRAAAAAAAAHDPWAELMGCASEALERPLLRALAQQLALHEHALFGRVRLCELQRLAFTRRDKAEAAPNVCALVAHFNAMSRWVCAMLVGEAQLKRRAKALRLFVGLASLSRELRNFNGVLEIVAALNSAAIYRLKRTWELLPAAALETFRALDLLMRPDRSHAALRAALHERMDEPTVPYLGLYLTDLLFLDEANLDLVPVTDDANDSNDADADELVNWSKCVLVGRTLAELRQFKGAPYAAAPSKPTLAFWSGLTPPADGFIFEQSLRAEPSEPRLPMPTALRESRAAGRKPGRPRSSSEPAATPEAPSALTSAESMEKLSIQTDASMEWLSMQMSGRRKSSGSESLSQLAKPPLETPIEQAAGVAAETAAAAAGMEGGARSKAGANGAAAAPSATAPAAVPAGVGAGAGGAERAEAMQQLYRSTNGAPSDSTIPPASAAPSAAAKLVGLFDEMVNFGASLKAAPAVVPAAAPVTAPPTAPMSSTGSDAEPGPMLRDRGAPDGEAFTSELAGHVGRAFGALRRAPDWVAQLLGVSAAAEARAPAQPSNTAAALTIQRTLRGAYARAAYREARDCEAARQWRDHCVSIGDYTGARELGWDGEPASNVPAGRHDYAALWQHAAIRLQAAARGALVRARRDREASRQWTDYYLSRGDYAAAREMGWDDDQHASSAARAIQAATRGVLIRTRRDREAIRQWTNYYLSRGDFAAAREMGWDDDQCAGGS